jgi:hypothetical protein
MRNAIGTERERDGRGQSDGAGHRSGHGRVSGGKAVQSAKAYLEELTGHPGESVSGLVRTREGWAVTVEVVELERVPRSTDLLASYRVEIDNEGELMGYERVHRYYRNQPGSE